MSRPSVGKHVRRSLTLSFCFVQLLDEISTGLDSSTTYQIVNCLRNICHFTDVSRTPRNYSHRWKQHVRIYKLSSVLPSKVLVRTCDILQLTTGERLSYGSECGLKRESVSTFSSALREMVDHQSQAPT